MQAGELPRASVLLVDAQPSHLALLERARLPFELQRVKASSGEEAAA